MSSILKIRGQKSIKEVYLNKISKVPS